MWSSPGSVDRFRWPLSRGCLPLSVPPSVLRWAQVAEGRVPALPVVEDLDEMEGGGPQLTAGVPGASIEQLRLQRRPEALHGGVIVGITARTHAPDDACCLQAPPEGQATELSEFNRSLQHRLVGVIVAAR